MDWLIRMNAVLDYIENNLDSEIGENKIAELSASAKGMFQRIFTALTNMTLSEYVRKRRLTQAAAEIQNTDTKIIDIAVKYGYNSADAFCLAFKNFHGVPPSGVRKSNIRIQSFEPLVFKFMLSVKGGNDMQYRIIENAEGIHTQIYAFAENIANGASEQAKNICEISETTNKMAAKIADIKDKELAANISQINFAVSQMEKIIQSNAFISEEMAECANELKELVSELEKSAQ
jgi:AraC family transcriptional regulator